MSALADRYRTALVTGASAGLGQAFARMLLAEGVQVWGTARDPARLEALSGLQPVALDLGNPADVERAFRSAEAAAGGLDLVVNNAGYGLFGAFQEHNFAGWQAQLEAMLQQTMRLSHLALHGMLARRRGALVNVSSLAAEFPLPYMSGYNVAKAGLSAFSESLMIEIEGSGVIVLDFRPGDYRTGFNQAMQIHSNVIAETGVPPGMRRAWAVLEAHLQAAPLPERAADDLRRALRRGHSGTVRSGGFFQAKLAPLLARLAPLSWRRAAQRRYFSSS